MGRHRGQCSSPGSGAGPPSSPKFTHCSPLPPEHTKAACCGAIKGAAVAAPTKSANQSNTQRAMALDWRSRCMRRV